MYDRSSTIKNLSIALEAATRVNGISNYTLVSNLESILETQIQKFKDEEDGPQPTSVTTTSTQDDEIPF